MGGDRLEPNLSVLSLRHLWGILKGDLRWAGGYHASTT